MIDGLFKSKGGAAETTNQTQTTKQNQNQTQTGSQKSQQNSLLSGLTQSQNTGTASQDVTLNQPGAQGAASFLINSLGQNAGALNQGTNALSTLAQGGVNPDLSNQLNAIDRQLATNLPFQTGVARSAGYGSGRGAADSAVAEVTGRTMANANLQKQNLLAQANEGAMNRQLSAGGALANLGQSDVGAAQSLLNSLRGTTGQNTQAGTVDTQQQGQQTASNQSRMVSNMINDILTKGNKTSTGSKSASPSPFQQFEALLPYAMDIFG